MDVMDAIKTRRSIRKFLDRPIEHEKIGKILEAFSWAPSAGNRQPWNVVIVDDKDKIEKMAETSLKQHWIKGAAAVMVVCVNYNMCGSQYGQRGINLYCFQSTAAATQNALLAAHDLGLAACWADPYNDREISQIIECPQHVKPISMIVLGYPDPLENVRVPDRHDIQSFSHYNKFGQSSDKVWKSLEEKKKTKPTEKNKKNLLNSLKRF